MPLEAAWADKGRRQKHMVIINRDTIVSLLLLISISISIGLLRVGRGVIQDRAFIKQYPLLVNKRDEISFCLDKDLRWVLWRLKNIVTEFSPSEN